MKTLTWHEAPVVFECEGSRLVGIAALPAQPAAMGVLIIVGGPQYRAGSHRQFTLLARHLAGLGIASLRFDYRGMGDSEGEKRSFDQINADIGAALATLLQLAPAIERIALWGLCDAASAAMCYAPTDARVGQLILLNPWLQSSPNVARTRLRLYYPARLGQMNFWAKLLTLEVDIPVTVRGFLDDLKSTFRWQEKPGNPLDAAADEHMLAGLERFGGQVLFIMSEKDLTAGIFRAQVDRDRRWQQACRVATFLDVPGADHTFSTRKFRDQVAQVTAHSCFTHAQQAEAGANGFFPSRAALRAELTPMKRLPDEALQAAWTALEARSDASIFQSWSWMKSWLEALPDAIAIYRLNIWNGEELVGIGLFGKSMQTRHKLIRSRVLWLSESGSPALDTLTIEHNNLLVARGWEDRVWPIAIDALMQHAQEWDEIRISGITNAVSRTLIDQYAQARGLVPQTEFSKPYFWVDLEGMRPNREEYLHALSRNTRQQIRRAMKLYAEKGPLEVSLAGSQEEALAYLEQLKHLHQAYWNKKGQPGAFSTAFSNRFHRHLVSNGFANDQIQLAKVTAGEDTIGILYNFNSQNHVCNYQAGLVYDEDPKLKPGLVCHALAIEMNIMLGNKSYDFLMGDSQYKRSLSTQEGMMYWMTLRQQKVRFQIEHAAKQARYKLHAAFRSHDIAG
ncbi:MAG TPA: hydrolase 1, exosortase A system-associated [Methylophilaceae bacterium]|nr:hydrolase 1, exosortase A system-associated [Methylophilaceae bacterium]